VAELAVGATHSFFIDVRVDPTLAVTTTLVNSAIVTSVTPDADSANNAAQAASLAIPHALLPVDLAISKVMTPTSVRAGEGLTYTIVVTNHGPGLATNVRLLDRLPAGVIVITATASQGLCNTSTFCELGDLAAGATATVMLVAQVESNVAAATIINWVRVAASNPDRAPNNNNSSATAMVTVADSLTIAKLAPTLVAGGQSLVYQIIVRNDGPSAAANVVISDTVPAAIASLIAVASQGSCIVSGQLVTCDVAALGAGNSVVVAIYGRVNPAVSADLVNRTTVTSRADPSGATATVTTTVAHNADLMVALNATPTTSAGETVTVTATLFNNGPSIAENPVVTITLPTGTSLQQTLLPAGWFATDNGDGAVTITTTQALTPGINIALPLVHVGTSKKENLA